MDANKGIEPVGLVKSWISRFSGTKFQRALIQLFVTAVSAAPGGTISLLVGIGGGMATGLSGIWGESEQEQKNALIDACLEEQKQQIEQIGATVFGIVQRLDLDDASVEERVNSNPYRNLVRRAFRDRSTYETSEKRDYVRKLLTNAATPNVAPDELITLFIDWVGRYNELHFKILAILRADSGLTRAEIWAELGGEKVRENSAEADLFATLITDLSLGHVIRQERATDASGNFLRNRAPRRTKRPSPFMLSRFDDKKGYELTELGARFVHYILTEQVPKLPGAPGSL